MRIPNAVHEAHPWRIHEIAPDFTVEDVWALPAHGDAGDFDTLVDVMVSLDFPSSTSLPTRALWSPAIFSDGGSTSAGSRFRSTALRMPQEDCRYRGRTRPRSPTGCPRICATRRTLDLGSTPFVPLYRTDDEYAAELSNRTVHAVLHLAWADQGEGRYQGQMAVYVKPRGLLGQGYMTFIKPFRYLVVYPALMRHIERAWARRIAGERRRPVAQSRIWPSRRSQSHVISIASRRVRGA